MGFRLPDTWRAPLDEMFAPWGEDGRALAEAIAEVGEAEHEALIVHRAAAYLAGRDQLLDAGKVVGIISQPDRVSFSDLHGMSPEERTAFATSVLAPLHTLEDRLAPLLEKIKALPPVQSDPFFAEVRDGVAITLARARYIRALYEAVKNDADSGSDGGRVADALAILGEARAIVSRRHADLHDGPSRRLLLNAPNQTVYQYGYLREASWLCFWERERVEVQRLLFGSVEAQPGCVL